MTTKSNPSHYSGYGAVGETYTGGARRERGSVTINPALQIITDMHEGYISQIRLHSQQANYGPITANFRIPRLRRRPMLRTKSESDFSALMDEDVEAIRKKLITRYGKRKHNPFPLKGVPKLTKKQKLVLASIALVDFTSFCAMSILAPFYPSEADKKEVPNAISGFVFSVYALTVFLSSPLMGNLINHVGPKFMLIVGIFLCGVCNILFGLLDRIASMTLFISYCFAVRIFEALGASMIATSCYTFVAQIFSDNIGTVLGLLEIFVGLGMSVGPAIGGLLYDVGGYGLPFFALGTTMLLTIPINWILLPTSEYNEPSESTGGGWSLAKLPAIIMTCCVVVVSSNVWGFLDPTLEPHLREFHLSAKQLGMFFFLISILYAVSSPVWGRLADKMEKTWILMVAGLLFSGLGLLLLGPAPFLGLQNTIWLNIVALIILGASVSMALLPTFEAVLDFALDAGYNDDIKTYGIIGGLWSSMYSLGEVTGPSLGGFLLQHYGFEICSTVMAMICFVTAGIVLFYFTSIYEPATSLSDSSTEDKAPETLDSGISENGNSSSRSSSVSSLYNPNGNQENAHEKTPLLPSSSAYAREESIFNQLLTMSSGTTSRNNAVSVPYDVPSHQPSLSQSCSYPRILKNVSVTEFGAVEV